MSISSSAIAATTAGLTSSAGALPADRTRTRPSARRSSSAAAIWLRPALWTQTKSTSGRSLIGRTLSDASERTVNVSGPRRPHDRPEDPVPRLVRRLDLDRVEARTPELRVVLAERQGARDAPRPAPSLGAVLRGEVVRCDDVADPEAAARAKHAMHLGEHLRLVHRQIDHAVGDDHVHAAVRQRDLLDEALH